jgi:hypothetical protein
MNFSAITKWIALALLGLAIAAAVAIAASNLVSRQIGIASESVSAGDALAPAVESAARQVNTNGGNDGGANPNTPPATTAEPEDDNGGGAEPSTPTADSDRADEEQDALEDRLDEEEDARDDREDALEDLEDDSGGSDNSGHGSDD